MKELSHSETAEPAVYHLITVNYHGAERAGTVLRQLRAAALPDVDDAVVVARDTHGKLHLHQHVRYTGTGALIDQFWGFFIGLIFGLPFVRLLAGGDGATQASAADYGLEAQFIQQISAQTSPGSSALFVLVRGAAPEPALAALRPFGGQIAQTPLTVPFAR
jgi:uncharacterized membrane protein